MIVCTLCGVRKDATFEGAWCARRGPEEWHVWSETPTVRPKSEERAIIRQSATIASVVMVVGFCLFNYWTGIQNVVKGFLAAVLGAIEWVVSWPWSAWICISILFGARRVARAIEQHGSKQGAEKEKAEK